MKVVWIVPGFSRNEDDWCIPALLDLARALAQYCDLHIVTLRYPERRGTYAIGRAMVHSLGGGHRGPLFTPSIWHEAARTIKQLNSDVLHAFWAYEPGWIAARSYRRAPIVISLSGGELMDLPQIHYGLIGRWPVRWMIRWALRRATTITAGSKYLLEIGQRFVGAGQFELAPLGVDLKLFSPAKVPDPSQGHILLNVASLEPVKDQATLLRAFRFVADQFPGARLTIAGQGRVETQLRHLAGELCLSDRVDFRGEIEHHHLPEVYRSATVYVQSSRHESQGMALLEAAACRLPIVGTQVGALADLAPRAAIATPVGDVNRLAKAMIDLLRDPDRAAQLGQAARETVEREYNLDCAVARFMALYRRVTGDEC